MGSAMDSLTLCTYLTHDLLSERRPSVFWSDSNPRRQRTIAIDVIEVQHATARRGELDQHGCEILREAPPMLVRHDARLHAAKGIRKHLLGHAKMPTNEFDSVHQ